MAGLKQLYELRKKATKQDALLALQKQMAEIAPALHETTIARFPQHIKDKFAEMESAGRNGDTEIRNVAGQPSHVTKPESILLDTLGRAATPSIQERGAGTINPTTGLPEYHQIYDDYGNNEYHSDEIDGHSHTTSGGGNVSTHSRGEGAGTGEYTGSYYEGWAAGGSANRTAQDWEEELWGGNVQAGGEFGDTAEDVVWEQMGYATGQASYEELSGYSEAEMAGYMDVVFDIGQDKMKYLTGFQKEPFQMMQEEAKESKRTGLRDIMSQEQKLIGQTGMATSGTAVAQMEKQRREMMSGIEAELKRKEYEEQERQATQFYEELGSIPD